MLVVCTGDRPSIDRVRAEADAVFEGGSVSPLVLGDDVTEAAFHVRPDGGPRADAFFAWLARQHRDGRYRSCHVVELSVLTDGHVVVCRSA